MHIHIGINNCTLSFLITWKKKIPTPWKEIALFMLEQLLKYIQFVILWKSDEYENRFMLVFIEKICWNKLKKVFIISMLFYLQRIQYGKYPRKGCSVWVNCKKSENPGETQEWKKHQWSKQDRPAYIIHVWQNACIKFKY